MNIFKRIYYLYKINKDKKQGKKLASYTSVCNDLSISDCCFGIRFFCKRQIEKVPDAPPYYFFDGDDKDNLVENNYPNYWYFRLGFLIVAELGINEYKTWKKEFDARVKEFVFPCLRSKSLYDNLCESVWYHKYQSIELCDQYKEYKELYKYIDERPTIYRVAEYSRKLGMVLYTLNDVFPKVKRLKVELFSIWCQNCTSIYKEGDIVLDYAPNHPYKPIVKLVDTNNILDQNFGVFELSKNISNVINDYGYGSHLISESRESMTVKSKTKQGEECVLMKDFIVHVEYHD